MWRLNLFQSFITTYSFGSVNNLLHCRHSIPKNQTLWSFLVRKQRRWQSLFWSSINGNTKNHLIQDHLWKLRHCGRHSTIHFRPTPWIFVSFAFFILFFLIQFSAYLIYHSTMKDSKSVKQLLKSKIRCRCCVNAF